LELVRKDIDVNEQERLSNITLKHKLKYKKNVNEELVVRKDIDINEHERLYNITLRHKLKQRNSLLNSKKEYRCK